jgi:asparagine synthase (glutamine-hydrolysing)
LIEQMLRPVRGRAPDGVERIQRGPVSLGLALLRAGASPKEKQHRLTLDNQTWIVADARIDARATLLRKLRAAGRDVATDAPHGELILHAWGAFGDDFLDHLIGDFAFALWDARRERLVCARDHFGVRPLHYAQVDDSLLVASDIASLAAVPGLSHELDDLSVADFLLFGMLTQPEQTIYRDIRCLPPGMRLDASRDGVRVSRYWEPPRRRTTWLARRSDYVLRFNEIFEEAVADRLPDGDAATHLSGGMDSTTIAAVAAPRMHAAGRKLTGYHVSCRSVVPEDEEGPLASLVAAHLQLPLQVHDVGDLPLLAPLPDPPGAIAAPCAYPHMAVQAQMLRRISESGARVLLSGYAADAVLAPSGHYYAGLLRSGRWARFALEAIHYAGATGSLNATGLRTLWRSAPAAPEWKPALPDWISVLPAAALKERWESWWVEHQGAVDAERQLRLPWLHRQFEAGEAPALPVVCRYPFLDLRLVEFLNTLPNYMLAGKSVLRQSMRGRLPQRILSRPKTGLVGDPVREIVTTGKLSARHLLRDAELPPSVVAEKFLQAWEIFRQGGGTSSTWTSWLMLQPLALGSWLAQRQEVSNG